MNTLVICLKLHAKLRFKSFLSFLDNYSLKVVQTWYVLHETWHTTPFGTYYCFEIVRINKNNHMLEITCEVAFLSLLSFFGTYSIKVVKNWFVWHETWHIILFGIYNYFEMVRIEKIVIYFKLCAKLQFFAFLNIFGTYSLKLVQTWFVWHKTRHKKLFGI